MEGKKVAKRKGKRSNFFKRPNRRAQSDAKTDTSKPGLEDIPVEASNNSDGEAGNTEMM